MSHDHHTEVEQVACPLCGGTGHAPWAVENGFAAVRCTACGLIYVNPRPVSARIDEAVRTGAHREEQLQLNVIARRVPGKIRGYQQLIGALFADVMSAKRPISWLDVGAGYGEVVEAVQAVAPAGSRVEGLEPMAPKAQAARAHGLRVHEAYLRDVRDRYDFVSAINVFSHVPDFREFLQDIKRVLNAGGEVLIETGNAADIGPRSNFPDQLMLPDHLVFAGEAHMQRFLNEAGFDIVQTRRLRIDGLIHFAKTVVKRLLGRPVVLALPYTSPTRTLLFRARLRST
jgi:2-polyprenyl-3-methyl-5-hydroxy-6-metoxy-1,4-benzoquinol methylase